MKKYILFLASIVFTFTSLSAQFDYGCDGERYVNNVITTFTQETVQYGRNVLPNGDSINLFMNVFSPDMDDADKRPIIILAHSGAFISGDKAEMNPFCERLAGLGYVAATIDYRLLDILNGIPDSVASMDIAVKASHDLKAAIRYFKASAASDNIYNIDGDMMFIGGYSAGAITALLTGVLDENEIEQEFILDLLEANGGFEGNSGNPDHLVYDTEVRGILNLSGAVYDTSWIDATDPVIQSFHGTEDGTVGFGKAFATVFTVQIICLHGSGNIIQRTENLGVPGYLYSVEGGDHGDIYFENQYENDRDAFTGHADTTFAEIICGTLVDVFEDEYVTINVYPNPASDYIIVEGIQNPTEFRIYNQNGQLERNESLRTDATIDVSHLSAGMYSYQLSSKDSSLTKSFVIIK
ncbi:T9SS type A sorting domain-containing protein [Saprospiraceae bacterium]|nr:T9SS type A sorting domain-containing protein [Saprospiraceae bacterium]